MGRLIILLTGLLVTGVTLAEDAEAWLEHMDEAARTLNYQGDFVFLRGDQMHHMQALHLINQSGTHVRLTNLDGPPTELLLHGGSTVDEDGRAETAPGSKEVLFSAVLPQRLLALQGLYSFTSAGIDRVAGRPTRIVDVQPLDDLRYGFRLWADTERGLLLKAMMLDQQGVAVEQFSFSRIEFDPPPGEQVATINESAPQGDHSSVAGKKTAVDQGDWQVTAIPEGFELQSVSRYAGDRQQLVDHLLFSDGLATVSVFVEPLSENSPPVVRSTMTTGGVTTLVGTVSHNQVTVMGEVPVVTLSLILNSLRRTGPVAGGLSD